MPTQRVLDAISRLNGGQLRQRTTLVQLRAALPKLSRGQLDAALLKLQADGSVALYHEDNFEKRTTQLNEASLQVSSTRYHLLYQLLAGKKKAAAKKGSRASARGSGGGGG